MDDLFKILIWGIIIISFLRPLFKKKEQPQAEGSNKQRQRPIVKRTETVKQSTSGESVLTSSKNDEYDILRELENMFKGEINIPQQQKQKQANQNVEYKSREIKDKDLDLVVDKRLQRDVEDKSPIGFRKTFDEKISDRKTLLEKPNQAKVISADVEANAKAFEKVLAGPRKQRAAVTEFNRKLKNPASVREYILFSEILGKPKALRR